MKISRDNLFIYRDREMMKIEDKEKIINEDLNTPKEQLIKNIDMLNDSINRNSKEIDMNKLIVLLIAKYNINPFANMKVNLEERTSLQ